MASLPDENTLRIHAYATTAPGPRLIVLGGVHGDETCGTVGIERTLAELDSGALRLLRGQLTMVPVANPLARRRQQREGERNLNRTFRPSDVPADYEDRITNLLCPLLDRHDVLLDLHSFTSQSSGVLTSTVWGDGLVDNPAGNPIAAGDLVRFIPFAELQH